MNRKEAKRNRQREKEILGSPAMLHHGVAYARDVINGRWRDWEKQALELVAHDEDYVKSCVKYAAAVIKNRWTAFEPLLLQHFRDGHTVHDDKYADPPNTSETCMWEYGAKVLQAPWPELEQVIIADMSCLKCCQWYAVWCRNDRWPEFENMLVDAKCWQPLTEQVEQICKYAEEIVYGRWKDADDFLLKLLGTQADDEVAERVLRYAAVAAPSRWPKLERHLSGHPEWILRYADRVLNGRLPDNLHRQILFTSFTDLTNAECEDYIRRYAS